MWSCAPGVLVGFHDIHFWAIVAADLVGITVVVTTLGFLRGAAGTIPWHQDKINGGVASASRLREVHVVADGPTKKVWSVEHLWLVSTVSICVSDIASSGMLKFKSRAQPLSTSDELRFLLPIVSDGDCGVSLG